MIMGKSLIETFVAQGPSLTELWVPAEEFVKNKTGEEFVKNQIRNTRNRLSSHRRSLCLETKYAAVNTGLTAGTTKIRGTRIEIQTRISLWDASGQRAISGRYSCSAALGCLLSRVTKHHSKQATCRRVVTHSPI